MFGDRLVYLRTCETLSTSIFGTVSSISADSRAYRWWVVMLMGPADCHREFLAPCSRAERDCYLVNRHITFHNVWICIFIFVLRTRVTLGDYPACARAYMYIFCSVVFFLHFTFSWSRIYRPMLFINVLFHLHESCALSCYIARLHNRHNDLMIAWQCRGY